MQTCYDIFYLFQYQHFCNTMITACANAFNIKKIDTFSTECICFVCFSTKRVIIFLDKSDRFPLETEKYLAFCEVRIKFLRNIQMKATLNLLTSNDDYSGRTARLTSKRCILYIYSTHISTEYFKHGIYSPFFSLQNAVCFIILTYLVLGLFKFYIQGVLK